MNVLLRQGTDPTVGDLPQLLARYREECKEKQVSSQFNHAKIHVQAFVRDTLRKRHVLYADISDIDTLAESPGSIVRRPQKPEALIAILQHLSQPHRRMAWELAATGMRPKEYWGKWEQRDIPPHLHIYGTKSAASDRDVPFWTGELLGPQRARKSFEKMWQRRIGALMDIYDLRRSYACWCEDAGIPRSRRKIYLGHASGDITGLYETRELHQWMAEDGAKLWAYAGDVVELELGGRRVAA